MNYFKRAERAPSEEILEARERRAAAQAELLGAYPLTLVSFTLNIPGEYKRFPLAKRAFAEGQARLGEALAERGGSIAFRRASVEKTGCEELCCVDGPAPAVKAALVEIEDRHPLGRLFDMDVLDSTGAILHGEEYGRPQRSCFLGTRPTTPASWPFCT